MTKSYKLTHTTICGFDGLDNGIGFCNSEFIDHFPLTHGCKSLTLVVSDKRQHKRGEVEVKTGEGCYARIEGRIHQILNRTIETIRWDFNGIHCRTFYAHVRNIK